MKGEDESISDSISDNEEYVMAEESPLKDLETQVPIFINHYNILKWNASENDLDYDYNDELSFIKP